MDGKEQKHIRKEGRGLKSRANRLRGQEAEGKGSRERVYGVGGLESLNKQGEGRGRRINEEGKKKSRGMLGNEAMGKMQG